MADLLIRQKFASQHGTKCLFQNSMQNTTPLGNFKGTKCDKVKIVRQTWQKGGQGQKTWLCPQGCSPNCGTIRQKFVGISRRWFLVGTALWDSGDSGVFCIEFCEFWNNHFVPCWLWCRVVIDKGNAASEWPNFFFFCNCDKRDGVWRSQICVSKLDKAGLISTKVRASKFPEGDFWCFACIPWTLVASDEWCNCDSVSVTNVCWLGSGFWRTKQDKNVSKKGEKKYKRRENSQKLMPNSTSLAN